MSLDYRVETLPPVWPGKATPAHARKRPQFKTIWSRAETLLAREIGLIGGKNVRVAVDVEPRHIRQDGGLRSDACPRSPAVVVSFDTKEGRLSFPCDTFRFWQENVDAIARALEALRMVDRYGVQQGRQYTGFKALPASTEAALSVAEAALLLDRMSGYGDDAILRFRETARNAVRSALARTHPDRGGKGAEFHAVQRAKAALEAHHGGAL